MDFFSSNSLKTNSSLNETAGLDTWIILSTISAGKYFSLFQ